MKDYEQSFVDAMSSRIKSGTSFHGVVEAAFKAKLGDVPGDILYRSLSRAAKADPSYFVTDVSKIFGRGAAAIYQAVALQPDPSPPPAASSAFQSTVQELLIAIPEAAGAPVKRLSVSPWSRHQIPRETESEKMPP